ncbi:MAG TPA: delta-60 repeat domain-containing protein [Solirubrobacterales bacterium]|nr:delta-60 repeat domain-containing protein [Solirubrobacterales bacterium]
MERPQAVRTRTGWRVAALGSLAGVLLLLAAAAAAPAQAAPGDLDVTFSGDGKQRTDFLTGESRAAAVVRQPDGKIVAVGESHSDFAIARYNTDGSLDTSFSGDGRQVTDFAGFDRANGVALQADGKIVAVGSTTAAGGNFALARYNPNGSLDTTFSGDGKQTTDLGGTFSPDRGNGVAIQADGKIVAVGVAGATHGSRPDPPPDDFGLVRYNTDGSLDTSFSGDGKQRTDLAGDSDDEANGVAIQADGKIVAVGGTGFFTLARYNTNGALDTSFSGDGKQGTDFGGFFDGAAAVALQADGKIVAVGFAGVTSTGRDFALARYNTNGTLDTSFSADGKQNTDVGGAFDGATAMALQGDGKIVAVGFAGATSAAHDFALARYDTDGSLDTSFSGDGKQTTDFGGLDGASGVALQGDGKIVAVGTADESGVAQMALTKMALARYNTDGSLDTSFSADGKQATTFGGGDAAVGVALQTDGKIVTVGTTEFGVSSFSAQSGFALARHNADGSLDTSFSGDGKQTTDLGGAAASGVAIQADGKIVVVGANDEDFALARYNTNGSLDTSFSGDGKQTTDFGPFDAASDVAIQTNGKIVVVGIRSDGMGNDDFALARYNPNGSLDTTFSGDGKQTTGFGGSDRANGVALQADGRIVVVGAGGAGADAVHSDFALARYNTNGSLDTSFSGDGRQTTDFGGLGGLGEGIAEVALQANGKIVAVGATGGTNPNGGDSEFALARYNPNGSLDTTFSGDGKQTTEFGGDDGAGGVALQAGGKIVAVGAGGLNSNFALARYNTDGSLDTSFSGDGRQLTDFGGEDGATGMALQGDGKIIAVGFGFGTDRTSDFALARYLGG